MVDGSDDYCQQLTRICRLFRFFLLAAFRRCALKYLTYRAFLVGAPGFERETRKSPPSAALPSWAPTIPDL
jgi:hypothetical protein